MLSFDVIIGIIIWCYHFSQFANVIIFVLSFFLVQEGCYHLCCHLMLSFFVIISPLFSFSWKRDTLDLDTDLDVMHKKVLDSPGKGNVLVIRGSLAGWTVDEHDPVPLMLFFATHSTIQPA